MQGRKAMVLYSDSQVTEESVKVGKFDARLHVLGDGFFSL
jgi:hypothetical protein